MEAGKLNLPQGGQSQSWSAKKAVEGQKKAADNHTRKCGFDYNEKQYANLSPMLSRGIIRGDLALRLGVPCGPAYWKPYTDTKGKIHTNFVPF